MADEQEVEEVKKETFYEAGEEVLMAKIRPTKEGTVPFYMAKDLTQAMVRDLYQLNIPLPNVSFHFGMFEDDKGLLAVGAAMAVEDFFVKGV